MKREAPVPLEVVEHSGFFYATIDFVTPSSHTANSHTTWAPLRPGWELVPYSDDVVRQVVTPYKWGGVAVVFKNGDAYFTAAAQNIFETPGAFAGRGFISQNGGGQYKPKKFPGCGDLRVLVRTAVTGSLSQTEPVCHNCSGLWKRRRFTDYTITCNGETIPCHRAVLAEASSVFDRLLDSETRGAACGCLEVKEAAPHSVRSMLAFMYTGKLEEEPIERIAVLMTLADRFGVKVSSSLAPRRSSRV